MRGGQSTKAVKMFTWTGQYCSICGGKIWVGQGIETDGEIRHSSCEIAKLRAALEEAEAVIAVAANRRGMSVLDVGLLGAADRWMQKWSKK